MVDLGKGIEEMATGKQQALVVVVSPLLLLVSFV